MAFKWAERYPELQIVCQRFNLIEIDDPKRFRYTAINGLLQDGPQCGLVALAMCIPNANKHTIEQLFAKALAHGYTTMGEMLHVNHMHELAKEYLPNQKSYVYSGSLDANEIREFLLSDGILLVPYDCDKNHSPCCLKGQKAHWAVVVGCVETDDSFYVIARHGKSGHVAIWPLTELAKSNEQLAILSNEFNSNYKLPNDCYDLSNLRKQALCISPPIA